MIFLTNCSDKTLCISVKLFGNQKAYYSVKCSYLSTLSLYYHVISYCQILGLFQILLWAIEQEVMKATQKNCRTIGCFLKIAKMSTWLEPTKILLISWFLKMNVCAAWTFDCTNKLRVQKYLIHYILYRKIIYTEIEHDLDRNHRCQWIQVAQKLF